MDSPLIPTWKRGVSGCFLDVLEVDNDPSFCPFINFKRHRNPFTANVIVLGIISPPCIELLSESQPTDIL